jgi:glycine/D-amino acid oxidase-like deaminating enzyme/nitrite reductase/ring-hydroxylating ferredoxin subunit
MNARDQRTRSLWMNVEVLPEAAKLAGSQGADVVIVGSGIAGLSTAYELAMAGQRVIVVDRGAIGGGMTARTTAHLAPICDDGISSLIDLRGEDMAKLFQRSQEGAVERIEAIVRAHDISCDFRRVEGFLFPARDMDRDQATRWVKKEYEAARRAGAAVEHTEGVPLEGFASAPCLRYPRQATFHPLKYLQALARAVQQKGGQIFANSPVSRIDSGERGVEIVTEDGAHVAADRVVVATNSPTHKRVQFHSKMAPYRTYAMAFTMPRGTLPDALYWDMADPYHYLRLSPGPGTVDYLIAGGEDHKSGEVDDGEERFERLESWVRGLVPGLGQEVHRWSGQVMNTLDHCGYIGRDPDSERIFVSTGDSGQGMTHGALAGILLKDLIVSGSSPWEPVYDPTRKTAKAIGTYVGENVTALKNFAQYLMPGDLQSADALKPGEGGILRDGLQQLAVCRDLDGRLNVRSAVCTHLGCHVNWNSTEQCWDCPCHGSQFAPDGSVLNGPALTPLAKARLRKDEAA